ncbi:MAG: hypothetical protein ACOCZ8_00875 [Bacteroidota bacterium]
MTKDARPLHERIEALNRDLQSESPEQLQANYDELLDQLNGLESDSPLVERIFLQLSNVMFLIAMAQLAPAIEQLHAARERLDEGLETMPEDEDLISLLVEWNYLAMRLEISKLDEFVEFAYYEEIIRVTENGKGHLALHHWRGKLGLINNLRFWQQQGGDLSDIDSESSAYLDEIEQTLEDEVSNAIDQLRAVGETELAVPLQRTLARFYLQMGRLEEALSELQLLAKRLDEDDITPATDVADVLLELGQLQLQAGQLGPAKANLGRAKALFESSGEDFEILAAQAEGLMEMADAS